MPPKSPTGVAGLKNPAMPSNTSKKTGVHTLSSAEKSSTSAPKMDQRTGTLANTLADSYERSSKRAKLTHDYQANEAEAANDSWGDGEWAQDILTDDEDLESQSESESDGEPHKPEMDEAGEEQYTLQDEYDEEGNFVQRPFEVPPNQEDKSAKAAEHPEPTSDAQFKDLMIKLELTIKLHEQVDTVYESVEDDLEQAREESDRAVETFATSIKHAEARKEKFHLTDRQRRACASFWRQMTQEIERIEAWDTKKPKPSPAFFFTMQEFRSVFGSDVDEDELGMSAPFCIAFMFPTITNTCSRV